MKKRNKFCKYIPSILLFLLFETVAVTLSLTKNNVFYLLNFSYIGGCLALGTALFTAGNKYARHFTQLAVGSYMLLYLGVISKENIQRCRFPSSLLQEQPKPDPLQRCRLPLPYRRELFRA